jgi:hypothetical protein
MKDGTVPVLVRGSVALLAALLAPLPGCDFDGRDGDGLEEVPPEIGAEQEAAMCERLYSSSSTGALPKTAGAAIGEGGAVDAAAGRKTINLVDFEGQQGGYVRLSINPENETPVFLMHAQDVPFAAVHEDGTEVDYEDAKEPVCTDAEGRYLWVVKGAENHLRFGPTSASSVDLVVEVVE